MQILLDECVPQRLSREIMGHTVHTVVALGWSGMKNGELLQAMTDHGVEVLLTVDQGIEHQQNMDSKQVAGIVLPPPRIA